MTENVNRKHTKKVAAVVTASLVGALSLGAAPVAAVAEDTGIDMQVGEQADAFSRGTVELSGATLAADGSYAVAANGDGKPVSVQAVSVTPLGAAKVALADNDDYEVSLYKANSSGNPTGDALESIVEPGSYVVTVEAVAGAYEGGMATAKLTVTAASLPSMYAYEVDADDSQDTSDRTFTYTGSEIDLAISNDGEKLVAGEDYTVKVLKAGTDNVSTAPSVAVEDAGDYVAIVSGIGQYAGQQVQIPVTVAPFDFSRAQVVVADVIGIDTAPTHPTTVSYVDGAGSVASLDPSLVNLAFKSGDGTSLFDKNGSYIFTASFSDSNANLTGALASSDVTVNKVGAAATYRYDGSALRDSYLVNKEDEEVFDLTKLAAYNGSTAIGSDALSVSVADGKAEALAAQQPGTYTVTVSVNAAATGYAVGGSATFKVTIVEAVVDADSDVYVYDNQGNVVSSIEKTYDKQPVKASDFSAKAFDDKGNEIAGTLAVKLYDAEGNEIDQAVDAGSYTLKVTSDQLQISGDTEVPVTIDKIDLSELKIGALKDWHGAAYLPLKDEGAAYTWADFDLLYDTGIAAGDEDEADDKAGWDSVAMLPDELLTDDSVTVEKKDDAGSWAEVEPDEACATEGTWRITIGGDAGALANYQFADDGATSIEFVVADSDKNLFSDVRPGDWFYQVVYTAKTEGWMNGYADTIIFGAGNSITRGEVACVLFNMADADGKLDMEGVVGNDEDGYLTGFSDVASKQFYSEAIAWAKQTGVVNGYGDGTFAPDAPVTREELAAMLANYARKIDGVDTSVADPDAALAEFPDGSSVSEWAESVVAWAVEDGIMGNGGVINPSSDIIRAEVAAMIVNYDSLD
ncbi:S-layer homology domain-containing protein [Collinsella tanakaei]|nr:S-layer homology domain-containing protein [Collinsella tanakaei]